MVVGILEYRRLSSKAFLWRRAWRAGRDLIRGLNTDI